MVLIINVCSFTGLRASSIKEIDYLVFTNRLVKLTAEHLLH